jgi:hypothetical protein
VGKKSACELTPQQAWRFLSIVAKTKTGIIGRYNGGVTFEAEAQVEAAAEAAAEGATGGAAVDAAVEAGLAITGPPGWAADLAMFAMTLIVGTAK